MAGVMVVGICRLYFRLHGNKSLKGKRSIVRKIVNRTRAKFNASVAEVADNDVLQRAVVGIAVVGNSSAHVDRMLSTIVNFVESMEVAVLLNSKTELIPIEENFEPDDDEFDWLLKEEQEI
jgi:uncharacterized protein YlxP (DUF503 family)